MPGIVEGVLLLAAVAIPLGRSEQITQQVIFAEHDGDWYRIPSLVVTPADVVLAFASRRRGSPNDFGHESDVVLRRSIDGGRTFQPMQTLISKPGIDIHHGPALVDRSNGRIFKFCRYWPAYENPQSFVQRTPYARMVELGYIDHWIQSDDDGRTWSEPRALVLPYPSDAVSCGTGNGNHGIQLRDGRLLIQGGFIPRSGAAAGQPHMCLFYSDDGGTHWQRGATKPHSTIREFAMAALHDGSVYFNFRTKTPGIGHRAVSIASDRGLSFGTSRIDDQLPEPHSHAGLLCLGLDAASGDDVLVFSNPNRENASGRHSADVRREMTVRVSRDGGRTWQVLRTLNRVYASYSDLAQTKDGAIHCIYENGDATYRDRITHARFFRDGESPIRRTSLSQ